jgi:tRNA dimethylallyltransferase
VVNYSELVSKIGVKIPIIVGPTGVGKTKFAINLAEILNGEIISVDSRQIYKGFIIGTAQPTESEINKIPHHLINCINPEEIISAGKYIDLIKSKINILQNKKIHPIIAGGTMLYVNLLNYGIINNADSNSKIRQKYEDKIFCGESKQLLNKLKKIDPDYAKKISTNDHKKLVRAFEIYEIAGKPPSVIFDEQTKRDSKEREKYFLIEIIIDRPLLRKKIYNRVLSMFKSGWVEEVDQLINSEMTKNVHPLQSVGYKQIIDYLNDDITKEETIELITTKTWQYAKKQLTWLKKMDIDLKINREDFN